MSDRNIQECIQKLAGTHTDDKVYLVAATVDSVDMPSRTCNVTTMTGKQSTAIEGVKLMPEIDDGFLLIPTVGSTVFLSYSNYNVPFVAQFSAIDQALIISGNSQLSITDQKIQLNDGSYGGLIQIQKLITKINNLENLVNDLAAKFNTHSHILTLTSGTGTAAPTAAPETNVLTPTQQTDIENPLITHGK
jgi:hypothetical protein